MYTQNIGKPYQNMFVYTHRRTGQGGGGGGEGWPPLSNEKFGHFSGNRDFSGKHVVKIYLIQDFYRYLYDNNMELGI